MTKQWAPPPNQGAGVFVGRQQEMEELKSALAEARSGQGRLVMLVGEPGIGKTRTAQELAAQAQASGVQTLWGWCYEQQGTPPFWPWVQLIRSYVHLKDPDQLRTEMGRGTADIAEIVPEVKQKLPDLEPPPAQEPDQARFHLFDSISTFLKNASRTQPLLLVLDDLQWADKPSLLLLQFLARQLKDSNLLMVGCYRNVELSRQHPLTGTLAQLSREPVFKRQLLRGLTPEDTRSFIQLTAGIQPSQQLAAAIHTRTEGNPFFMNEMIRLLTEQAELTAGSWTTAPIESGNVTAQRMRLPEGVKEVIGQRLNRLSEQCYQVLTVASIIGKQFDFQLLKKLHNSVTEEQLLEVIDEAIDAHLIEEVSAGGELYQFNHTLTQQTLSEELSTSRRIRLHARVGEALEGLYGDDAEINAAALVYHFAEAEPVVGMEKLVHYSLLAGERALAAYAYEEALAYFQRGLAAKRVPLRRKVPARDAEEAALLFGLGRAQAATVERHLLQEAVDLMSRAFDYYLETGDVVQAVVLAQYPYPLVALGRTGVAPFIPRALELVPPDSLTAGRLLASYGAELGRIENDYEGAHGAFSQALAIARQEKDLALEARTLAASANMDLFRLHLEEALEKVRQVIALAQRLEDHQLAWVWAAHVDAARALELLGEVGPGQQHAAAALELAEKLHDHYRLTLASRVSVTLDRHVGDWQRARDFSDHSLTVAPHDNSLLSERVLLEYQLGDFHQAEAFLERLLEGASQVGVRPDLQNSYPALTIPWVARVTGELDWLNVAVALAQSILSSPSSNPLSVLCSRAGLGIVAVLRGDAAAAREQYEALECQRGFMLAAISTDHLLGLLAHTIGNLDRAFKHFEDALAFCRKAGCRPELAWTCHDYAEALLVWAGFQPAPTPENRVKAVTLLEEVLSICAELDTKPLLERAQALQDKVNSPPRPASTFPDGLTQREVEVLRLIAIGKSNREIAESLTLSVKTVDRHVSNIFAKTGASNRTEASWYATRHRLVSG
jgi:DNA-binding CsgD family transcriptional regulator/pterin-4a-carbinolamine dehydratase